MKKIVRNLIFKTLLVCSVTNLNCDWNKWHQKGNAVDAMGAEAQKVKQAEPIVQKVPVKIDAAAQKPNDGGSKLDAKPKRLERDWGHPQGIPYKKSKARERFEKLQQTP